MKHARISAVLALAALLTAGCLGDDENKAIEDVRTGAAVTDQTVPPAPPDTPLAPAPPAGPTSGPVPQGPAPAPVPSSPATAPTSLATTAPKTGSSPTGGTANVVQGVVRDEQGDPVPGAVITAAGYTARSNNVQRATTDAGGRYRLPVTEGLYTISGHAPIVFQGKTFNEMYLHPTDGNCGQQMSAGGITKDFVLRLTGLHECRLAPDPANYGSYNGAAVSLIPVSMSLPGDTTAIFTLTPSGPLADGSPGKAITFTRTIAQLSNTAGPLEASRTLHDIPLGRYTITGRAGARDLLFGPHGVAPVAAFTLTFEPVAMAPYGIRLNSFDVTDTAAPSTPPPTTTPSTAGQCWSEYVGWIPC